VGKEVLVWDFKGSDVWGRGSGHIEHRLKAEILSLEIWRPVINAVEIMSCSQRNRAFSPYMAWDRMM
jgi:hypothetical protein